MEMIAHEDVHMWFGNLVTLKSWDMIWLNEGLATFFAAWVLDQVFNKALPLSKIKKKKNIRLITIYSFNYLNL